MTQEVVGSNPVVTYGFCIHPISPKVSPKAHLLDGLGLRFENCIEHQVLRGQELVVVGLRVLVHGEFYAALT